MRSRTYSLLMLFVMLFTGTSIAAMVNLAKEGTPWVWRVDAESDRILLRLENESAMLNEDASAIRAETVSTSALYNQLKGQGWTETNDPANLPQGISGDHALAYELGLLEDGSYFAFENSNNLRLEN